MWKLLVYVWAPDCELGRCYVFEFNTETTARNAAEFFNRGDCTCKIVPDPK